MSLIVVTTFIFTFFYQSANSKKVLNCNEVIDLCLLDTQCNNAWKNINKFCSVCLTFYNLKNNIRFFSRKH